MAQAKEDLATELLVQLITGSLSVAFDAEVANKGTVSGNTRAVDDSALANAQVDVTASSAAVVALASPLDSSVDDDASAGYLWMKALWEVYEQAPA